MDSNDQSPHNSEPLGWSVTAFVREALRGSLSRAALYKLWSESGGPKRTKIGKRVIILRRDAEEWLSTLPKD